MSIVQNKKAFHDYFIEQRFEAGIALEGWEVKAIRAGRAQIKEAYVTIKGDELFLFGAHISALPTASTHISPEAIRTRQARALPPLLQSQASSLSPRTRQPRENG